MINIEELLLKLVAELKVSEFEIACDKADISELERDIIARRIHERGE